MFKRNFHNMGQGCCERRQGCPIVEPAINNCVEREFCHEVEQE